MTAPAASYRPYVEVTGIENPELATIPELHRFQQLAGGERVIRQYDMRVRRPASLMRIPVLAMISAISWGVPGR